MCLPKMFWMKNLQFLGISSHVRWNFPMDFPGTSETPQANLNPAVQPRHNGLSYHHLCLKAEDGWTWLEEYFCWRKLRNFQASFHLNMLATLARCFFVSQLRFSHGLGEELVAMAWCACKMTFLIKSSIFFPVTLTYDFWMNIYWYCNSLIRKSPSATWWDHLGLETDPLPSPKNAHNPLLPNFQQWFIQKISKNQSPACCWHLQVQILAGHLLVDTILERLATKQLSLVDFRCFRFVVCRYTNSCVTLLQLVVILELNSQINFEASKWWWFTMQRSEVFFPPTRKSKFSRCHKQCFPNKKRQQLTHTDPPKHEVMSVCCEAKFHQTSKLLPFENTSVNPLKSSRHRFKFLN